MATHDLNQTLTAYLAAGWRVESTTPTAVALVSGQNANHILHVLLSIFTCGLWLPIWLIVGATTRQRRVVLSVGESGEVTATADEVPRERRYSSRERLWWTVGAAAFAAAMILTAVGAALTTR